MLPHPLAYLLTALALLLDTYNLTRALRRNGDHESPIVVVPLILHAFNVIVLTHRHPPFTWTFLAYAFLLHILCVALPDLTRPPTPRP